MTDKKVKEVIEQAEQVEVTEEVKLSYQEQVNSIENQILELQEQKKALSKLMLEEVEAKVEMPLAQLNMIAHKGYEAAKKHFGKAWVE